MEEILTLDIPKFQVEFEEKDYRYSYGKGRENLKNALYRAGRNYCMYCYTRIKLDEREFGRFEHAIEKKISVKCLTECIPDIGIACGLCNEKYKRIGEKRRRPSEHVINRFEERAVCTENCRVPCEAYQELKDSYLSADDAHIILQPQGVIGKQSGEELRLQYDVLEALFVPDRKRAYTQEEKHFICDHIDRFHLNARNEKTKQLIRFIEDTIEKDGQYTRMEPGNLIVELFVEQVLEGKSQREILKICKLIYRYSFLKFAT